MHSEIRAHSLPEVIISFNIVAQSSAPPNAVVNQPTEWFIFASNVKLSQRINVYTDLHLRYVDNFQPMQNQFRVAVEYIVSNKLAVAPLGYAYIWNFIYGDQPATYENNERRFYQQLTYRHSAGKFSFNHRFRFEERFLQVHSKNSSDQVVDEGFTNVQYRLRYRGMLTYALNAAEIKPGTLFLSVYDEVFISRGAKVVYYYPDQNRVFAGLGYQFAKNISLQSGFLYQLIIKSSGTQQENNIGVLTQFTCNFDLSKN